MWPKRDSVDQRIEARFQRIARQIHGLRAVVGRQGVVVAGWRRCGGPRLGPYYRVAYRDQRRQRSIYLGRSEALAEKVRQLLAQVQGPWRRRRAWRHTRAELMAQLRRQKARWEDHLRAWGLYAKGFSVRGWRRWQRPRDGMPPSRPPVNPPGRAAWQAIHGPIDQGIRVFPGKAVSIAESPASPS